MARGDTALLLHSSEAEVLHVREKAHRRVYGRECVHVGGGESRVKGGKS